MPTADLRALAERLGMLKRCECLEGCNRCVGGAWSPDGLRLPVEAEVRAAIFEAGVTRVGVDVGATFGVVVAIGAEARTWVEALVDEAVPDELVLLALLRALEACHGPSA